MAQSPAVGTGPVALIDDQGKQFVVPLSALRFANGAIEGATWPGSDALSPEGKMRLSNWLTFLARTGHLRPGAAAPPRPAFLLEAAEPGSSANDLQVRFDNVTPDADDPAETTFDVTVTDTDTYAGLSIDPASPRFVKTVLGTGAVPGIPPGLVRVKSAGDPVLPAEGSYPLTGGGPASRSSAGIGAAEGDDPAFVVEARKEGADGRQTTVTVSSVDAEAGTFTLAATWEKTVTGLKAGALAGSFDYAVKITPAPGGGPLVPAPGAVRLSGGSDAAEAAPAAATVFAGE